MKSFKVFLLSAVAVMLSSPSYSYPMRAFNAKSLVTDSDVVCKIRVTLLACKGESEVNSSHSPLKTKKVIAEGKVISTIKGDVPDALRIIHPERTAMVTFTAFSDDEVTIVFLKRVDEHYEFTDVHNGKMACVSSFVKYEHGKKPLDRLLSELLALCNSSTGRTRLSAIEHLGELGDIRASKTFRALSGSADPSLRGVALVSRIKVGDSIKPDTLLDYLGQNPVLLDHGKSLTKYRISGYTISNLTRRIMRALENSVVIDTRFQSMKPPRLSRVLPGFDYITFFEKASALPALVDSPGNRRSMVYTLRLLADKRAIPLVKWLLDDSDPDVRYLAVTALTRIYQEGPFPSTAKFKSNEEEYISYWKDKLAQTE